MEIALEIVVRCTEIDVNGHVNNAKFVEYLEWGREEWYDRLGLHYDRLHQMGAVTVVVNMNINLRKPCYQGDQLRIVTWPVKRGRTSFVLGQRIEREGVLVADGLITLVTIDPATSKSRPVPDELARWFPEEKAG
jgi:thioesterase-3